MKDIDYDGNKKYTERFTPEDLDWLRKDLSYVPKGSTVFLNVHAPVANNTVSAGGNARNANTLFQLLRPYQVHIFRDTHISMRISNLRLLFMNIISELPAVHGGQDT